MQPTPTLTAPAGAPAGPALAPGKARADDRVPVRPYTPVLADDGLRVREALARAGGNRSRAAQLLGMTRRQFTYRLDKLGDVDPG